MALPVDQVNNNVHVNPPNHDNLRERVVQLSQRANDVMQRNAEAKARLNRAQGITETLIPYVKNIAAAAGGVLGFAVSRALGSSPLMMCITAAGGAVVGRLIGRHLTRL